MGLSPNECDTLGLDPMGDTIPRDPHADDVQKISNFFSLYEIGEDTLIA